MVNKFKIYLKVFIAIVFVISCIITTKDLINNTYIHDYLNYKSLKEKEKMNTDTLLVKRFYYHNTDNTGYNVVTGFLLSNKAHKKIAFSKEKYLTGLPDYNPDSIPVYKNRYTGKIYLKGSEETYYRNQISSLVSGIIIKILFFLIPIIYLLNFIKNRNL